MKRRLHHALEAAAARTPHKPAVFMKGRDITYRNWDIASNQLAHALKGAGCSQGDRIGLLLPKSIEALIGMFGAMKAGCIYVPLDTSSPSARLTKILQSADCRCVLAVESTTALLNELVAAGATGEAVLGWMDKGGNLKSDSVSSFSWENVQAQPMTAPEYDDAEEVAHILFTSGTTGAPKGVMITHDNVITFVDWAVEKFGMNQDDRNSGHPPFHFDLSTFDIHGTVATGAEIHLVPPELNLLPSRLADFIRNARLTQWFSVPSILTHMAKSNAVKAEDFPALKRLLWCGEKFPTPALMHWMQRLQGVEFFNLYGPTEATIASSCYQVTECPAAETEEIPIGEPCGGESLLVLDENLQAAQPGEAGDLYIGGAGLSPGYWRDATRTDEVFGWNPAQLTERIYKTGDLARRGENGHLYLLGRSDSQIKSRGYRIELGEIEAALHSQPQVRDAAVVAVESGAFEGTVICCAWVPAQGHEGASVPLKLQLGKVIPSYMLPAQWMVLEQMPLNGNGKTDRRCLKEWFREKMEQPAATTPPAGRRHHEVVLRETARTEAVTLARGEAFL